MLKLMTFNIRNGGAGDGANAWRFRRELVAETVRQQNPDILGFQEVLHHQLLELARDLPDYDHVGVAREDGRCEGEFAPIFFRSSLQARGTETFWLSETPEVVGSQSWNTACTRVCTVLRLDGFAVFNCHLDHISQEARTKGLRLIASRAQEPAIIMGDFNVPEGDEALAELSHHVDTYRAIHPDGPEPVTYQGFNAELRLGEKIDYIFVSPGIRILDAAVIQQDFSGRAASDHFAVVATIEVP